MSNPYFASKQPKWALAYASACFPQSGEKSLPQRSQGLGGVQHSGGASLGCSEATLDLHELVPVLMNVMELRAGRIRCAEILKEELLRRLSCASKMVDALS